MRRGGRGWTAQSIAMIRLLGIFGIFMHLHVNLDTAKEVWLHFDGYEMDPTIFPWEKLEEKCQISSVGETYNAAVYNANAVGWTIFRLFYFHLCNNASSSFLFCQFVPNHSNSITYLVELVAKDIRFSDIIFLCSLFLGLMVFQNLCSLYQLTVADRKKAFRSLKGSTIFWKENGKSKCLFG